MTDRRRHRRFVLEQPLSGRLQVERDIRLESIGDTIGTALARTPTLTSEPVTLRLMLTGGQFQHVIVRALANMPVRVGDTLWQRIGFQIVGGDQPPRRLQDVLSGVLVRTVPAYLLQVSATGCLLETTTPLDRMPFARLDVSPTKHEHYSAMVRVCRAGVRMPGSGRWHVGAEFVPFVENPGRPIQQFVAQHEATTLSWIAERGSVK